MPSIVLKADGKIHSGWKNILVRLSMESIADVFDLTISDRWSKSNTRPTLKEDTPCEVWLEDQKLVTGFINDVATEYDADSHEINLVGRSKLGDLVDCAVEAQSFKNQTLDKMAKTLCEPFGINVIVNANVGKPFVKKTIGMGESPFEFLDRLAKIRAVRLLSDREGNLVISRASNERITTALELGKNILRASGTFTSRDRFKDYIVYGQSEGTDDSFGASASENKGESKDAGIKRHRPMVSVADGTVDKDDCKKRAQWERNTRYGRSRAIVYTVLGWQHANGLWLPNQLVPVKDSYMNINEDRLIVSVQFSIDDSAGQITEIQLMPKEAFELVELPDDDNF